MPLTIVRQDITKMKTDAIVNAANTALQMGGGVCGAIFHAAGVEKLQKACDELAPIGTGEAAITPGFALPAKYIIHAAGPVYSRFAAKKSRQLLESAYKESLKLAESAGCESIAFPLISSGIYGYPKKEALEVARLTIREYLAEHEMQVYLVIFDRDSYVLSRSLLGRVESYIDDHYVGAHSHSRSHLLQVEKKTLGKSAPEMPASVEEHMMSAMPQMAVPQMAMQQRVEDLIGNLDEPFSEALLRLIDAKGRKDVEVYKKANIDRKLFSKIRTGKGYTPKKPTILALAIALELTLPETDELLKRAGYALSHASKFDVIVEFFIMQRNYDVFEINEVLFQYDQPLLGA